MNKYKLLRLKRELKKVQADARWETKCLSETTKKCTQLQKEIEQLEKEIEERPYNENFHQWATRTTKH